MDLFDLLRKTFRFGPGTKMFYDKTRSAPAKVRNYKISKGKIKRAKE